MKRRIEDEKEELQQTINRFPLFLLMVMMIVMVMMMEDGGRSLPCFMVMMMEDQEKEELQQTINRFPLFLILMMIMVIIINVEIEYDSDGDGGSNSREGGPATDYQKVPLLVIFLRKSRFTIFFSLIIFPVLSCCHKGWTFLATA